MRVIGEDLDQVSCAQPFLERAPPAGLEYLAVLIEENVLQAPVEAEKLEEGLREDVILADVEPRLGAHLVLLAARLRHVAEAAVGDAAELIVVVEDHAVVARDAEIL